MESTAPAKSQPLHNFNLPNLKWNMDGNSSSSHNNRRRSIKSPSRRLNLSSAPPIRHLPLRYSISAPPQSRLQSPFRDAFALSSRESPVDGDLMITPTPVRRELSRPSLVRECFIKRSLTSGDPERLSLIREETLRFRSGHSSRKVETSRKSKGASIECRGNHSWDSASSSMRTCSSSTGQGKEKSERKSKATRADIPGIKRSKIFIKIPSKNNNSEEKASQEEPHKVANNGDHGGTEAVQEEGKLNDNVDEETRIPVSRPRKSKGRTRNATGVDAETGNGSGNPENSKKALSSLKNANKSGDMEPSFGRGSEKKEKRKLSICIALSKWEIEEDIYALSGLKPTRGPKKRPKTIQKKVDSVFPGLWLVSNSVTLHSYKVCHQEDKDLPKLPNLSIELKHYEISKGVFEIFEDNGGRPL